MAICSGCGEDKLALLDSGECVTCNTARAKAADSATIIRFVKIEGEDDGWRCRACRQFAAHMLEVGNEKGGPYAISTIALCRKHLDELAQAAVELVGPNRADLIDKMQAPDFGTVGAIQRAVSAVPGVAGVEVEAKPNSVHIIVDTVDHTAVAGDLAQAIRAAVPLNVATTGMTGWCGPLNVPRDDVRWTWKRDLPTESVCDCVESPHLRDPVHGCEDCRNTGMIYD